jgi:diguanylate cyclase (GGDEF)-like protein/PAS domain S-box-containing protein
MIRSAPTDETVLTDDAGAGTLPAAPPGERLPPARLRSESQAIGQPGRRRLAQALFAPGGALAAYPGPAAAIGPGDVVLAANEAAEPLLDALVARLSGELRLALDTALAGAPAQMQPLLLPSGGGEPTAIELMLLPFPDADAALLLGRDVTLERALRTALVDSRQRYKDLVEAAGDFVWETGADGRFVFVSPGGALGYRADELIGRPATAFIIGAQNGAADSAFPFDTRSPVAKAELQFRGANGTTVSLVASCRPVLDEHGRWRGARGACQDVTEQRARESEVARLRHRERLLAYLVRTIRYEVDPRNAANAAAIAALPALAAEGCRVHRADDTGAFELITECGGGVPELEQAALDALANGEKRFEGRSGNQLIIGLSISHGRRLAGALTLWRPADLGQWDEDDLFLLAELADQLSVALQQIASQEALATLSRTDSLTGLVNRRSFVGELRHRLAAAGRRGALLYLDLDNFKPVNDRLGHARGDAVLMGVARLLRDCTRSSDLVGRLGGDEFVAWLADIDEAAASAKAAEILRRVAGDLGALSAGDGLPLGASIGIAMTSAGAEDVDQLIARADDAMYAAKHGGKQRFVIAPAADATVAG